MGMTLETGTEEAIQHDAMRLMKCIIANSAVAYGILDALYVGLRVGGGFSRGRKMSREVGELTRYQLVGYITALAVILLRGAPREPHEANSIVAYLETLVFLPGMACRTPCVSRVCRSFSTRQPCGFCRAVSSQGATYPVSSDGH